MTAAYLHASTPLEMKLAPHAAEAGIIEGYASIFNDGPDSYGDIIAPGAYSKSLAEHAREGTLPALLWAHDQATPAGSWVEAREDSRGLFVRGQLNLETETGRRAHSHVKAGDSRGLSIGYTIFPDGLVHNHDGTRTLKAVDLKEVSLVTIPAQRRARITGVKSFESRSDIERILRDAGVPGRAASKLASGGWPALGGDEEQQPDPEIEAFALRIRAATLKLKAFK